MTKNFSTLSGSARGGKYAWLVINALFLLLCCAGRPAAQARTTNLVANSGFETLNPANGQPAGFEIGKDAGAMTVVDEKEKHGGARSIRIISGDNPQASARIYYKTKDIEIIAGRNYTCSVWSKLDIGEKKKSKYGPATELRVRCMDAAGNPVAKDAVTSHGLKAAHDWQRQFCTILAPTNTKYILIDTGLYGAMCTAWIDDLQLEEGDAPSEFHITK